MSSSEIWPCGFSNFRLQHFQASALSGFSTFRLQHFQASALSGFTLSGFSTFRLQRYNILLHPNTLNFAIFAGLVLGESKKSFAQ